jgi:hypothetical protein
MPVRKYIFAKGERNRRVVTRNEYLVRFTRFAAGVELRFPFAPNYLSAGLCDAA